MRFSFQNRRSSLNSNRLVAGQRSRAQCRFATYPALVFLLSPHFPHLAFRSSLHGSLFLRMLRDSGPFRVTVTSGAHFVSGIYEIL